jgi:hypothetical protein
VWSERWRARQNALSEVWESGGLFSTCRGRRSVGLKIDRKNTQKLQVDRTLIHKVSELSTDLRYLSTSVDIWGVRSMKKGAAPQPWRCPFFGVQD